MLWFCMTPSDDNLLYQERISLSLIGKLWPLSLIFSLLFFPTLLLSELALPMKTGGFVSGAISSRMWTKALAKNLKEQTWRTVGAW